jgi:hypothetical protein
MARPARRDDPDKMRGPRGTTHALEPKPSCFAKTKPNVPPRAVPEIPAKLGQTWAQEG